ncbi:hypothetical protein SK069_11650 [Patulibacter brassicae]|uniref:D-glucuronyl C5-epimerase C-terminal domain-containing protein n=1 Tax=Patulibacter brassicae TaxID=1705717 RepID=A0ABU4VMZ8_9ACTN|nr:hypothetical protein [Patulibacter brassicae]MDX8152253.1 hypothetical protein [Patulibacter brassicae]
MTRRRATVPLCLAALLAVVVALVVVRGDRAAAPSRTRPATDDVPTLRDTAPVGSGAVAARAWRLADRLSVEWVDATVRWERRSGRRAARFPSTRGGFSPGAPSYGQLLLAHGVLRTAARRPAGDRWRATAVRVASSAIRTTIGAPRPGAFAQLGMALLWSDRRVRSVLPPPVRRTLARRIRALGPPVVGVKAQGCQRDPTCYSNLKLVEAAAGLELVATGLRGGTGRLADADATAASARAVLDGVRERLDGRAAWRAGSERRAGLSVLSDPPNQPLAYHALSLAMWARAASRLEGAARGRAQDALVRLATTSLGLAAPDGDLTYLGRGQAQAWVQAATLAGAVAAAHAIQRTHRRLAGELVGLADASLGVLEQRHRQMGARGGLAVVPEPRSDYRGVDRYASHLVYNGLALLWLGIAADRAAGLAPDLPGRRTPARRSADLRFVDGASAGTNLTVVRRGRLWIAIHQRSTHPVDPRYGWGLLKVAWRDDAGRWVELTPQRPLQEIHGAARPPASRLALGPLPVDAAGRPLGEPTIAASRSIAGGVAMTGTAPTADGGTTPVTWSIAIRDGAVRIAVRAARAGRWSLLPVRTRRARGPLAGGARPVLRAEAGATWSLPAGARVRSFGSALHSAWHADLWADRVTWTAAAGREQVIRLRPPG